MILYKHGKNRGGIKMKIVTIYFKTNGSTQRWKYVIENESKIKEIIEKEMKGLNVVKTKIEDLILENGYAYLNLVD